MLFGFCPLNKFSFQAEDGANAVFCEKDVMFLWTDCIIITLIHTKSSSFYSLEANLIPTLTSYYMLAWVTISLECILSECTSGVPCLFACEVAWEIPCLVNKACCPNLDQWHESTVFLSKSHICDIISSSSSIIASLPVFHSLQPLGWSYVVHPLYIFHIPLTSLPMGCHWECAHIPELILWVALQGFLFWLWVFLVANEGSRHPSIPMEQKKLSIKGSFLSVLKLWDIPCRLMFVVCLCLLSICCPHVVTAASTRPLKSWQGDRNRVKRQRVFISI